MSEPTLPPVKFWFDVEQLKTWSVYPTGITTSWGSVLVYDTDMPRQNAYTVDPKLLCDTAEQAVKAAQPDLVDEITKQKERIQTIEAWLRKAEAVKAPSAEPVPPRLEENGIFSGSPETNSNIDFIPDPTEGRF